MRVVYMLIALCLLPPCGRASEGSKGPRDVISLAHATTPSYAQFEYVFTCFGGTHLCFVTLPFCHSCAPN